jgi:hypothetical protein
MGRPAIAPTVLRYYSQHDRLGHGWRLVVAYDRTAGAVSLLCPSTLVKVRVPASELRHAEPADVVPARLARRIEERRSGAWRPSSGRRNRRPAARHRAPA